MHIQPTAELCISQLADCFRFADAEIMHKVKLINNALTNGL